MRWLQRETAPDRLIQTWLPRLLFTLGIACLGYVAYVLLDARIFAWVQGRRFDEALAHQRQSAASGARLGSPAVLGGEPSAARSAPGAAETDRLDAFRPSSPGPAPAEGEVLGRIEIPRVGISSLLLEGIEPGTLHRGAGHIPDTVLPDQWGNVGIAAHRDSFFRGLKDIQVNDLIKVTTLARAADYRVDWTRIVEPADVGVLDATPAPVLTLVTCYPFYYVGSAPHRFIVRAHRVEAAVVGQPAGGGR
jgi:sortase A